MKKIIPLLLFFVIGMFLFLSLNSNPNKLPSPLVGKIVPGVNGKAPANKSFRLGGLVETDSFSRDGMIATFSVTDNNQTIEVAYEGILPDLFREGQGVVVSGSMLKKCVGLTCTNTFVASKVLAKHDENYMPPEVAAALEISSSEQ